jgi:hypothetical protein
MKVEIKDEAILGTPAAIVAQVEARIRGRLGGQASDVRVVMRGDGMALQGHSRTHHAKQLAQHVAMEATELPILANEIQVA